MMKLSEEHRQQIVRQLRTDNVAGALQTCRELTSCDASDAESVIRELQSEISDAPGTGRAWTLITGLFVFVAILATVYLYVFPRLIGERVSPTAMIEVRPISMESRDGWTRMKRIDGTFCYVESVSLLSAGDFSVFQGDGLHIPPTLTLYFSEAGIHHSSVLRSDRELDLGVVLPNKTVVATDAADWSHDRMVLPLHGVSAADANEIFARLTN